MMRLKPNAFTTLKNNSELTDNFAISDNISKKSGFSGVVTNRIEEGEHDLRIMGYDLTFWEENFSFPLHLHHLPTIAQNIHSFRQVFTHYYPNGKIRFAVKSSSTLPILKMIASLGEGAEVGSSYETAYAFKAGFSPKDLVVTGNCKEDFFIEEMILQDILMVADNIEELKNIAAVATKLGKKARILVRVSGFPLNNITATSMFTSGFWSKFGLPLQDLPELIDNLDKFPSLEIVGLHVHIGSQLTQVEPYLFVLEKLIEYALLMQQKTHKFSCLDLGGGFPVSYLQKTQWEKLQQKIKHGHSCALKGDFSEVFVWNNSIEMLQEDGSWVGERFYSPYPKAEMLAKILTSEINVNGKKIAVLAALRLLGNPELIIEPGRSIMEESGITLARVGSVHKNALNHNVVALEVGISSMSRSLFRPVYQEWMLANNFALQDAVPFETFIVGNLCFNADILARFKITFPRKPKRGDVLLLKNNGAYSSSFLESNPNSYPLPSRVFVDNNGAISVLTKKNMF